MMNRLIAAATAMAAFLAAGTSSADVLNEIAERGSIRLGVRADAPPFSYKRPDGSPAGLAVSLCHQVSQGIAKQLGRERLGIEFITVNARQRFPALIEGRTDLHCGPVSATLKRRESLDLSILYFVDGAAAAVRPGTYETVFDTKAGKFGVLGGTTTEAVVEDLIERNDIEASIETFEAHTQGLSAISQRTAFFHLGKLIEVGKTSDVFTNPREEQTQNYITGRIG